jgi:nitroreductase
MSTLTPTELTQQLQWRYATKVFDPSKKIPAQTWSAIEQSLVLTPSSFGLQPWRFVVVTDQTVKEKLRAASWGQSQVTDCSHHVVFTARRELKTDDITRFIARTAQERGVTVESLAGYQGMMNGFQAKGYMTTEWAAKQCYIALGQLMAVCAVLGVDACPMEGFEQAQVDDILGLKAEGYTTAVCCPLGYRAASDKYPHLAKVRYPSSEVVHYV